MHGSKTVPPIPSRLPRTKLSLQAIMPNAALSVLSGRQHAQRSTLNSLSAPANQGSLCRQHADAALSLQATCQRSISYGIFILNSCSCGIVISGIKIRVRTPLDARSRTRIITTTTLLLI